MKMPTAVYKLPLRKYETYSECSKVRKAHFPVLWTNLRGIIRGALIYVATFHDYNAASFPNDSTGEVAWS